MTRLDIHDTVHTTAAPRRPLILSGSLILGGMIANTIVTSFHPSHEDPNDHPAVFGDYARDADWIWVHWAQWVAALTMIAGFIVLYRAFTVTRPAAALDNLAFGAAVTSAAAVTVLQAIDGVALKHTVNAWAAASGSDRAARFADAEAVRWLEWGVNSFFYATLGVTVILFGAAIVRSRAIPAWLGWTALLTGAAFVATALPVSYHGFAARPSGFVAVLLLAVTAAGLLVTGLRTRSDAGVEPVP